MRNKKEEEEYRRLLREYFDKGGKITKCPEGSAIKKDERY